MESLPDASLLSTADILLNLRREKRESRNAFTSSKRSLPSSNSQNPTKRRRTGRPRESTQRVKDIPTTGDTELCNRYIEAITSVGGKGGSNLPKFIRLLIHSTHPEARTVKGSLKRLLKEDDIQRWIFEETREEAVQKAVDRYTSTLNSELEELGRSELFGEYKPTKLGVALDISQGYFTRPMTETVPSTVKLFTSLCQSRTDSPHIQARISAILQIITYTRHQRTSNFLPAVIGMVLHSRGVKKSLFSLTNALGLTESYDSVLTSIQGLRDMAKEDIRARISDGRWLVAYDNLDLSINTHEQTLSQKKELYHCTTAVLIPGLEFPVGGLNQSMFHPGVVLKPGDLMDAPGIGSADPAGATITKKICRAFVFRSIQNGFPGAVAEALAREKPKRDTGPPFPMPQIDIIKVEKGGPAVPLFPIQLDESTVENNIDILRDIHVEQCGLSPQFFEQQPGPALLVGGDNKTLQRIWKACQNATSNDQAYDKLKHIVPLPGLFHVQMNLGRAIIGAYWKCESKRRGRSKGMSEASNDPYDRATLQYAAELLGRKFVGPDSSQIFTAQRSFINDNYDARILALVQNQLHLPLRAHRGEIDEKIAKLTYKDFGRLIRNITDAIKKPVDKSDQERLIHFRFLRDAEMYLTFHYAVKYGDIGLIVRCVNQMTIFFHGTGKWAYAHEMLYLKYITDTEYADKVARRALLASLLVNKSGQPDSFFPIDLANEMLNLEVKETWKARHSSTSSLKQVTEYCTIAGMIIKPIATALTELWGRPIHGRHPPANRTRDLAALARQIRTSISSKPSATTGTDSLPIADVWGLGIDNLLLGKTPKLSKFNQYNADRKFDLDIDDCQTGFELEGLNEDGERDVEW